MIYLDSDFRCHLTNDGTMTPVNIDFDGKCKTYIEGYRFIPEGKTWKNEHGIVFVGEMAFPWKPYSELDIAQRAYEQEQYAILLAEKHSYTEAYNQGVNEA